MIWFFKKKNKNESKPEEMEGVKSEEQIIEMPQQNPSIEPAPISVTPTPPKKFKVRYEWKKCIGSAVCEAVAPQHFRVENGKATLIGSKITDEANKIYEKEITEAELDANRMAADGCPPNCIHVINIETGEEIAPKK
ncbi:MAG: ferredoxin [Candidatus Aenigmarchaeota archaeon]|nr:ferredoxin [Candidatus Aenigmarchaeota archaeon]